MAEPLSPEHPLALKHYQIQSRLGEGGFAQVYQAWDNKLQRNVAIKRLKAIDGVASLHDMLREARLAASLKHAAFVKIHALEDDGDTSSIVMELVPGRTLKQLLAETPPSELQALMIVRDIAEAMCEAHESGMTHGDLKPTNLMLEPSGAVRILDFGLAVHNDPQATVTLSQSDPQGTIAYMAPERLQGAPLSPLCDIYALGVVLYELAAGTRPFANLSGLALAAAHLQSSSDQWHYPATMHPELAALIRRMTAHSSLQRLPSMREAHRQLAALVTALHTGTDLQPMTLTMQAMQAIPGTSALVAGPRAPNAGHPQRRRLIILTLTVILAGAAWMAAPYAPYAIAMLKPYKPFLEALEMQKGMEALKAWDRQGGLDDAESRFGKVLDHSPANAAAVAGLSMVYNLRYWNDNLDDTWRQKCLAAAQQALALNDQLALSHAVYGNALVLEGKGDMAGAAYDRALRLDPTSIFAMVGKAQSLRKLRHLDEALKLARQYLRDYPQERLFADLVGTILYEQQDFKGAEQAFRDSIKIQPDAVISYANLSAALLSQGRPSDAMQVLQQGLQVRPSAWLYGNLGNALFMRADYVGAVAAFQAAVSGDKGNPNDYLGWANLGDAQLWIPGREADARSSYQRAIDLLSPRLARAPDNDKMVSQMALYYARVGNRSESELLLQRALKLGPDDAYVHFRAGMAYELIGNRASALEAIARARKLGHPLKFIESAPELVALRRDPRYVAAIAGQ
jgi:tetratricopeptide (TPR) repeat protein